MEVRPERGQQKCRLLLGLASQAPAPSPTGSSSPPFAALGAGPGGASGRSLCPQLRASRVCDQMGVCVCVCVCVCGVCQGPRVRFWCVRGCVRPCSAVCMGLCDLQLPGVHGRVHLW